MVGIVEGIKMIEAVAATKPLQREGAKLQEQTTPDSHLCESNLCVRSFLLFKPPKHATELHKEGTWILQSELNDFLLVLCVHAIFLPPRVILGVCKYL